MCKCVRVCVLYFLNGGRGVTGPSVLLPPPDQAEPVGAPRCRERRRARTTIRPAARRRWVRPRDTVGRASSGRARKLTNALGKIHWEAYTAVRSPTIRTGRKITSSFFAEKFERSNFYSSFVVYHGIRNRWKTVVQLHNRRF